VGTGNASSWTNFSVHAWLTSSTFYILFNDTVGSDSTQSTWNKDATLLWTYPAANYDPINEGTPSCSNPDDTDNLYARYKHYNLLADASDQNGVNDIKYVDLTLTSNDQQTTYWAIRFTMVTKVFSEVTDPSDYITLNDTDSDYSTVGNILNLTFSLTIEWVHPDVVDTDMKQFVRDNSDYTDTDWTEVNYDVETRLDVRSPPQYQPNLDDGSGTEDRGDYDTVGGINATVGIKYFEGGTVFPPADEVDVWWYCTDVAGSPWEATNYDDATSNSSVLIDSDDIVGSDQYYMKAVEEDAGGGGTDLMHTAHGASYIANRRFPPFEPALRPPCEPNAPF